MDRRLGSTTGLEAKEKKKNISATAENGKAVVQYIS
jgi:hypothetical protein